VPKQAARFSRSMPKRGRKRAAAATCPMPAFRDFWIFTAPCDRKRSAHNLRRARHVMPSSKNRARIGLLVRNRILLFCLFAFAASARAAPTELVEEAPVSIKQLSAEVVLLDFGRVTFGNLKLAPLAGASGSLTVHLGEALVGDRINRTPPGAVRYAKVVVAMTGDRSVVVAPPPDKRNTTPPAILTPPEWGTLLPFRWVELEGWRGKLEPGQVVRRSAYVRGWPTTAASFHTNDEVLNRIWELGRDSIKATSFAGVFVDGDRERIPYEADAYLNQLSFYACNPDPTMVRDTFDRLVQFPTWPTEWAPHLVFMAYADWMQTGDRKWLAARYESLKRKLLLERAGPEGLIRSNPEQIRRGDIVDWPAGERDQFEFSTVNTVVNAFHLRAVELMARLADALERQDDALEYKTRYRVTRTVFLKRLFDPARGLFRDGEGVDHSSLHANLFPLAFGLVPEEKRAAVAEWLAQRGMVCSVYAAQYLLQALFENGQDEAALALMTAPGNRSWRHMLESGTTITWEAWDQSYKPNQDWNHAWGAAPVNLLPTYVLGVRPRTPGWSEIEIRPARRALLWSEGRVPTPRGPIEVRWDRQPHFHLRVSLPKGVAAHVALPPGDGTSRVFVNGREAAATRDGAWLMVRATVSDTALIELR